MELNTQVYNRNLTKGRKIKKKLHMGKEASLQPVIPQNHVSVPGYGCAEFRCIPQKVSSADESHPIKLKTMNSRLYFTHPVSIQFESFTGNMATSHFIPTDVLHTVKSYLNSDKLYPVYVSLYPTSWSVCCCPNIPHFSCFSRNLAFQKSPQRQNWGSGQTNVSQI